MATANRSSKYRAARTSSWPDPGHRAVQRNASTNSELVGMLARSFAGLHAALDAYTLADLIDKPKPLQKILQIQLVN
ncbi:hypothetical protein GCM10025770_27370 [Viridibacterium curvum]|uniref:Uncharacterized protein n=1 Tax=Viridibacterium curvum TaxID=1101404 RepID=A0ABP9QVF0_9RHOO